MQSLDWIFNNPYHGYAYSYPHKAAYRAFRTPKRLHDIWEGEDKSNLFLYVHIPFCEMRCGFCNLFTTVNPQETIVTSFLSSLEQQMIVTNEELCDIDVAQMAIGGGTPTFLSINQLSHLFILFNKYFDIDPQNIPVAIETSPRTAEDEKLKHLSKLGVERVSIGIQSFIEQESKAIGRPQKIKDIQKALDRMKTYDFPCLNLDLIYGCPGQTEQSWTQSLSSALKWQPEEIYIYPLYVRPQTGIDGKAKTFDQQRLALYQIGRDFLLANGYQQISMRKFCLPSNSTYMPSQTEYCCQEDGMLGLGAGARSYSFDVHYSHQFAVKQAPIVSIIKSYCDSEVDHYRHAYHGIELTKDDIMRRDIIKSILNRSGLDLTRYATRHQDSALDCYPELKRLIGEDLLIQSDDVLRPTALGLKYSDAIGSWLMSKRVKALMAKENEDATL